jgi:acyl-CoA reductase-like NAD-dependent aldehyde dehydrogenase
MARRELDEAVEVLWDGAPRFAALDIDERIRLLRAMRAGYARVAFRTVVASCRAKRIVLGTPLEGEEWSLGPWPILRHFRGLLTSLASIRQEELPRVGMIGAASGNRLCLDVFPANTLDSFLLPSLEVQARFGPGIGATELDNRARYYRSPAHPERVALVLGTGNAAAIPCMDVLTKLFNDGSVCLLKMHPLNSYLGPLYEEAFAMAIEQGYLRIVYGGAEAGAYLARHPGIGEIHLTGSAETYDDIVWGEPVSRAKRKSIGKQVNDKPITAQLGCVSPVLIVPGPYLDRQLAFQAASLAGAIAHNAGCNCTTPRLLVMPADWAQRNAFLRHLEEALAVAPLRLAYYPGATERWQFLAKRRAGVRFVGTTVGGMLPWTLVPDLDPADTKEPLFSLEPFCPIVSEVQIGSSDPLQFLESAVDFVNERVWGTLSATMLIHPRTLDDPEVAPGIERALSRLRYGTIGINTWPQASFALASSPWGPHQASAPADIQSGHGWVHNTSMLEAVEKVVIEERLSFRRKPIFSAGHRSAHHLFRRLAWVEHNAGWAGLPAVIQASYRG